MLSKLRILDENNGYNILYMILYEHIYPVYVYELRKISAYTVLVEPFVIDNWQKIFQETIIIL
jgi:hypothetical protein